MISQSRPNCSVQSRDGSIPSCTIPCSPCPFLSNPGQSRDSSIPRDPVPTRKIGTKQSPAFFWFSPISLVLSGNNYEWSTLKLINHCCTLSESKHSTIDERYTPRHDSSLDEEHLIILSRPVTHGGSGAGCTPPIGYYRLCSQVYRNPGFWGASRPILA